MSHLYWFKSGDTTRGTPRRMTWPLVRLVALAFIGGAALLQSGCRSAPTSTSCSSCGDCGKCSIGGYFSRATNRILHRNRVYSEMPVSDGVVEYGGAAGVVVPGAIPSYPSGGSMGTAPSNVSPSTPNNPIDLEPAPTAKPGATSGGTGPSGNSGSGVRPLGYTTRRPGTSTTMRSGRSISSTPDSTTQLTSRSAQDASPPAGSPAEGSLEDNFLDHLPPLGLPKEVTKSSATPPSPPSAPADTKSREADKADSAAQRGGAPTEAEFALTIAADPTPETVSTAGAGAGFAHFATVDPKLAGGCAPSEAGLSWLSEKGYRTLLDLRESTEVPPSFIAEVARRGLRYIALPLDLKAVDRDHVARFNFELASADARPTFFFDSDGSRAGALWYIRRVTVDRVDPQIARREAEELGLVDKTAWLSATNYVEKLEAARVDHGSARSSETSPLGDSATAPSRFEESDKLRGGARTDQARADDAPLTFQDLLEEVTPPEERSRIQNTSDEPLSQDHPGEVKSQGSAATSASASDAIVWRPFAAMILTGLSIPLAYWTRTTVPDLLTKARASLMAPGQQPRSLPHESGA